MTKKITLTNFTFLILIFFSSITYAQDVSTLIAGEKYYIDNIGANKRLKSNNGNTDVITTNTTDTNSRGQWELIDAGNGNVYLQNIANGMRLQGMSNTISNESSVRLGAKTFTGNWVKWKLTKKGNNWLIDNKGHNTRLTINGRSEIIFGSTAWAANWSQWRISKVNDVIVVTDFKVKSHTPSNATKLSTNGSITLTFNDAIKIQEANNIDVYINKSLSNNRVSWSSPSSTKLSVRHNSRWKAGDLITVLIDPALKSEAGIRYASNIREYEFIVDTEEDFGFERIRIKTLVTRNNGRHNIPLQVALPKDRTNKVPVHIWVHGGGWSGGSPAESNTAVSPHSEYLAEELGIATFEIAYRTIGSNGTFTQALEDIESAYQWAIDNARRYNFDLNKIFLSGGSAGTPLASLFTQRNRDIKAFVGFNGIYNFSRNPGSSFPFNGSKVYEFCEPSCNANSSIFNLRNNPPATLLLHGNNDNTINHTQSTLFASAINKAGGKAKSVIYPRETHAFFNKGKVQYEDCLWEMANFLKENSLTQLDNGVVVKDQFYIDNVGANKRLTSNTVNSDAVTTNISNNSRGRWEFIDAGNGYVYIQNVANGMRLQGLSNKLSNESAVRLGTNTFTGSWVKWKLTKIGNNWLIDNQGHNTRLTINGKSEISFGNIAFGASWSQWRFTNVNTNRALETSLESNAFLLNEFEDVELNIYPNPVKLGSSFYLDYSSITEGEDLEIRVSNISGATIISQKVTGVKGLNSYEVSANELSMGLYFVELFSNGEKITVKKMVFN